MFEGIVSIERGYARAISLLLRRKKRCMVCAVAKCNNVVNCNNCPELQYSELSKIVIIVVLCNKS